MVKQSLKEEIKQFFKNQLKFVRNILKIMLHFSKKNIKGFVCKFTFVHIKCVNTIIK